jgi:DNA-binding transcriptional ArsR family regulator
MNSFSKNMLGELLYLKLRQFNSAIVCSNYNSGILNTFYLLYFRRLFIFMSTESSISDLPINEVQLKKAAHIIRALNHKLRQQIIRLIHENGRMTVTDIYVKLHMEQSVASQHLAILRTAGYVNTEREGKFIFYSVNYSRIKEINQTSELLNKVLTLN